jgi:pimeloyl-ACP methyl ester carboxylesterase
MKRMMCLGLLLLLFAGCGAPQRDLPLFLSEEGREIYFERYDRIVGAWSAEREDVYVPTSLGRTHVILHRNPGKPAILLLHAAGVSAASWYANFDPLSRHFQVLAVDTPGDAGKSELHDPTPSVEAYNRWILELLDHFDLSGAVLCGHSIGAFIATRFALAHPSSVEKLILLAPAATFEDFKWYVRLGLKMGGKAGTGPKAETILRLQAHESFVLDPDFVALMSAVRDYCSVRMIFPHRLSDEELTGLRVPTLVLFPEDEIIYDPARAAERARALLPGATIEIVPQCGHTINMEQPAAVNRRIIEFCVGNQRQENGGEREDEPTRTKRACTQGSEQRAEASVHPDGQHQPHGPTPRQGRRGSAAPGGERCAGAAPAGGGPGPRVGTAGTPSGGRRRGGGSALVPAIAVRFAKGYE